MNKHQNLLPLVVVCLVLIISGCKCTQCKNNRAPLIDEFRFVSLVDAASGYNHCTNEHVIGIAKGGNACSIAILGLDGWGITDSSNVVVGEVTGPESFSINSGQIIEGRSGAACSFWRNLRVTGSGSVYANLLDFRIQFTDSTGQYNSGMMQYTYERQ